MPPGNEARPQPPARVLDITRLGRRAGRTMTGIDRVEYAYVQALSADPVPCYGLAKTSFGYVLVRPGALAQVAARIMAGNMRRPDVLSRLAPRMTPLQRRAETELRAVALMRGRPFQLERMLRRHAPPGFSYVNVGHSNLTSECLSAVEAASGRISVMVHDVIPLDHPEFQRHGTEDRFRDKMKVTQRMADLILYNSADTRTRAEAQLANWGPPPPGLVAHLGVDLPAPEPGSVRIPEEPFFLCLGTIEPRKNLGFLLDLWDSMGDSAPRLLICGNRGWRNEDVFARLDALPEEGRVTELRDLSDTQIATLMSHARAVLFPSLVEGFGLPAAEAATLGTPVICNDLPVYHEVLGDIPIYASVKDAYLWEQQIKRLGKADRQEARADRPHTLTWDVHFKQVLSMI